MCFGGTPSVAAAPVAAPSPAPPPPQQSPRALDIDPQARNSRDNASTQRTGTSVFRNDLTVPTGSSVGAGLNIPV